MGYHDLYLIDKHANDNSVESEFEQQQKSAVSEHLFLADDMKFKVSIVK